MLKNLRVKSIDFVYAIHQLVGMKDYSKEAKKMGFDPTPEITELLESLASAVSMRLFEELKVLSKKYFLDSLMVHYAINNPELEPEQLVVKLGEIGKDGLYDAYIREAIRPHDASDAALKERVEMLLENNTSQFVMNYHQIKRFKSEAPEVYVRMMEAVTEFAKIYKKIAPRVNAIYDREIKLFEEMMADEERFRNSFLMIQFDGSNDMIQTVEVCVTVIPEFMQLYKLYEERNHLLMVVGFGIRRMVAAQEETLYQEVFKTLGDPTKLEIIQLASKTPVCAKDLSDLLSLSKATISHHISLLIGLKLLTLNLQEGKKMYYSTNKALLKRVFENFIQSIYPQ